MALCRYRGHGFYQKHQGKGAVSTSVRSCGIVSSWAGIARSDQFHMENASALFAGAVHAIIDIPFGVRPNTILKESSAWPSLPPRFPLFWRSPVTTTRTWAKKLSSLQPTASIGALPIRVRGSP